MHLVCRTTGADITEVRGGLPAGGNVRAGGRGRQLTPLPSTWLQDLLGLACPPPTSSLGPRVTLYSLELITEAFYLFRSFPVALWPLPVESGPWLPQGEADTSKNKEIN